MKKRIASLLLALPLCLTLLPTTALAEDEAASDRTVIATVEDLQQFARAVDAGDYDGKTDAVVELAADLDLTGIEWTPIGSTVNADYSKVEAAIAKAEALNKNEYKDFTKVEEAVNAVVRGKNITEQTEVEAMAKAIEDAIAALEYKDADYSKVDAAIAKAEALNKNEYKDFTKVEEAVNAVVRGKNITEQAEVDAMAKVIEDAIAALERKPAKSTPTATAKPVTVSAQAEAVKETAAVSSVIPQTGDNWNKELHISLFVLSGFALAGTAVLKNRKPHK